MPRRAPNPGATRTRETLRLAAWFAAALLACLWLIPAAARADTGYASYFGPGLWGNRMACGGRLTPATWGVAHRWLPCGARVTVCYRRCATAPVIDRGPYTSGRVLDLTAAVARYVGLSGVGRVRWWRS